MMGMSLKKKFCLAVVRTSALAIITTAQKREETVNLDGLI